mmetsp:Transcript_61992/g.147724  ORF Transcript_61992/g.147724 Transcript_61992/m.147724 type:complete len:224 (-) Transcript_61992:537-1208(-)
MLHERALEDAREVVGAVHASQQRCRHPHRRVHHRLFQQLHRPRFGLLPQTVDRVRVRDLHLARVEAHGRAQRVGQDDQRGRALFRVCLNVLPRGFGILRVSDEQPHPQDNRPARGEIHRAVVLFRYLVHHLGDAAHELRLRRLFDLPVADRHHRQTHREELPCGVPRIPRGIMSGVPRSRRSEHRPLAALFSGVCGVCVGRRGLARDVDEGVEDDEVGGGPRI